MNEDLKTIILQIVLMIAAFLLAIGIWVGYSFFEARTFNKLTGSNISTFDAMFIQLRVQEPSIKNDNR